MADLATREPDRTPVSLTPSEAEVMLALGLGREVCCLGLKRLTGGCVYTVLQVEFEGAESPVVLKVSGSTGEEGLLRESRVLTHLKERGVLVPKVLFYDISGCHLPYSFLILERLPGMNMGDALTLLSAHQREELERTLGEAVAHLHQNTEEKYGFLGDEKRVQSWLDCFGALLQDEWQANVEIALVSTETLRYVEALITRLPEILDAPGVPSLIHGDLWASNIMVDPESPRLLSGFLDPVGASAHREYELAYLQLWETVGDLFFEAYHQVHSALTGYELRRSVYWLHTLLLHVRFFREQHFVDRTETVVQELRVALD